MSRENVEAMSARQLEPIRQKVELRPSRRRRMLERFYLRFPRLGERLTSVVLRRRPDSPVRRTLVRLSARWALESANRGDWEATFAILPPDYETYPPPELVGLGFKSVYHGRDERLGLQLQWMDQWGDFQQQSKEVIDLGDRLVLLAWMRGIGLGSGAEFESELSYVIEIAGGRLHRERFFRSHAEGLEAAGLSE